MPASEIMPAADYRSALSETRTPWRIVEERAMSKARFMGNPAYVECVRLLRRVHDLNVRGVGDCEERDRIADDADRPWSDLDGAEKELFRGLSVDFSSIRDPARRALTPLDPAEWQRRHREALAARDWDALLALVRLDPGPTGPADLMFSRARWWYELGDGESALLFAEEAARLDPTRWNIARFRSFLLLKLDREDEAIESLVDFAEAHPEGVPPDQRDRCRRAIEERARVRETKARLYAHGLALIRDGSTTAA
jgi:hypothetical protein